MTLYEWCIEQNKKEMLDEWDNDKNTMTPRDITYGSTKNVYWKCSKGHSWYVSPNKRTSKGGSSCPVCLNKKVHTGYNDLLTLRPDIVAEWDYEKNSISPNDVTEHSNKSVYWLCSKGHSYKAKINDRTKNKGTGCPVCANQRVLSGYNDLETLYPELAKEYNRDNILSAYQIYGRSKHKVKWTCRKGHEYEATIIDRVAGNGCPYCAGRKVLYGFNDLETLFPEIAKEWDYEKNKLTGINPQTVIAGSTREVWWRCNKGHSWKRKIEVRTHLKTGCPYCAGQRAVAGENDIATKFPELLKEWDYEMNGERTPYNTMPGAGHEVHWICPKGHKYIATPNARTSNKQGCPICSKERHTSFPEQAIVYYLSYICEAINRYIVDGVELDIYIPDIKVAFEYDGVYYHKGEDSDKREIKKNNYCKENGITLYRIKETNKIIKDEKHIFYRLVPENGDRLNAIITELVKIVQNKIGNTDIVSIDVSRDREKIWELYITLEKDNSLKVLFPEIAEDWDYETNGKLMPDQVTVGSHKKVHWICDKGHKYMACIKNRVMGGTGCPYCANKKVLPGYNDLSTTNAELAAQWDYAHNGDRKPESYTAYSGEKVFWLCEKGHSYLASISKRSCGRGCPYCANKKVLAGYNDIATTHPEAVIDWDYDKNNISPMELTAGSQKKVYWKCHTCGCEIYDSPYMILYRGFGCKSCKTTKSKAE